MHASGEAFGDRDHDLVARRSAVSIVVDHIGVVAAPTTRNPLSLAQRPAPNEPALERHESIARLAGSTQAVIPGKNAPVCARVPANCAASEPDRPTA